MMLDAMIAAQPALISQFIEALPLLAA
jgi:hypothetical protein